MRYYFPNYDEDYYPEFICCDCEDIGYIDGELCEHCSKVRTLEDMENEFK